MTRGGRKGSEGWRKGERRGEGGREGTREGEVKRKKKKRYRTGEWQMNEHKCADERRGETKSIVRLIVLIA
jgi:hypothetical protein